MAAAAVVRLSDGTEAHVGMRVEALKDSSSNKYKLGEQGVILEFDVDRHNQPLVEWASGKIARVGKPRDTLKSLPKEPVSIEQFVNEIQGLGIKLVVFDIDGIMIADHSGGLSLKSEPLDTDGPTVVHPFTDGFIQLALELKARMIRMCIVTNNSTKNVLPCFQDNIRKKPCCKEIAETGIFHRIWCHNTLYHHKDASGNTMPHGDQGYGSGSGSDDVIVGQDNSAAKLVNKNAKIRMQIHRSFREGSLANGDIIEGNSWGAGSTLLIDDSSANTDAFKLMGGHIYHHPSKGTGLTPTFDLERLDHLPNSLTSEQAVERSRRLAAADLGDRWDEWLGEWMQLPEGGGGKCRELPWERIRHEQKHYNYAASGVAFPDDTRVVFYCTNRPEGKFRDHVAFRIFCASSWSEEMIALSPGVEGAWDSHHVCDPEVVEGRFWLHGELHEFCMFYLGKARESGNGVSGNQIGAAFSRDRSSLVKGEWTKVGCPVLPFLGDHTSAWGVGQPSATTVSSAANEEDGKWKVLLFYTQGDEEGTRLEKVLLTFHKNNGRPCSMDGIPSQSKQGPVTRKGLEGTLHNAAFAFVPRRDGHGFRGHFYLAREGKPRPRGWCEKVSDHVQVARITDAAIWGTSDASWEHVLNVGCSDTGRPRNHNAGFIRDPRGMCLPDGRLPLLFTVAEADSHPPEWTYRVWQYDDVCGGGV